MRWNKLGLQAIFEICLLTIYIGAEERHVMLLAIDKDFTFFQLHLNVIACHNSKHFTNTCISLRGFDHSIQLLCLGKYHSFIYWNYFIKSNSSMVW